MCCGYLSLGHLGGVAASTSLTRGLMVHCDFVITLSVYDAMQINIVISRQNFANTFAETPNLNLEVVSEIFTCA